MGLQVHAPRLRLWLGASLLVSQSKPSAAPEREHPEHVRNNHDLVPSANSAGMLPVSSSSCVVARQDAGASHLLLCVRTTLRPSSHRVLSPSEVRFPTNRIGVMTRNCATVRQTPHMGADLTW